MDPVIAPSVQLYAISTNLYGKALDGLDRQALVSRVSDDTNPLLWIAGHLASARCGIAGLIGIPRERPWGDLFNRGAKVGDLASYPEVGEIRRVWESVTPDLMKRFDAMTDAELAVPSPRKFPIPDPSLRGAIAFMGYHESYHIGQMSYIRKWLGLPGLVDG